MDVYKKSSVQISSHVNIDLKPTNKMSPSLSDVHRPQQIILDMANDNKKNLTPVIETHIVPKFNHPKNHFGLRCAHGWEWTSFINPARDDGVAFCHWQKVSDKGKEYPFAKFNKKTEILKYTDEEYREYLVSKTWTRKETDRLFGMCERFDLRFIVIQGRWAFGEYEDEVKRTTEDLKDRYYSICNILKKIRGQNVDKETMYDACHETRRKQQLEKLYSRTSEQIINEKVLLHDLCKIEIWKNEVNDKKQILEKLVKNENRKILKIDKNCKRNHIPVPIRSTKVDPNNFKVTPIKFPDIKNSGVYTRTPRMKIPANVNPKKETNVMKALQSLKIETKPIPTEDVCHNYNNLRNEIVLLSELKAVCESSTFEFKKSRHQYKTLNSAKILKFESELIEDLDKFGVDDNDEQEGDELNINKIGFLFVHDEKCENSTEQKMYRIYEDNSSIPWTLKTLSPSDFPFTKGLKIDEHDIPVKSYSQDTNITYSSEEIDSSRSYFDITNIPAIANKDDIIINEKVNNFLKWNTEPINPIQKTEHNDHNSEIQPKNRLLSGLDQNIKNRPSKCTIRDKNNKKRAKTCRSVCWNENVKCYMYRMDSSLSTIDLCVEPCKTEDCLKIKNQTHLLDDEYTEPNYANVYKKNQKPRNEMPELRNTCRPLSNYISNQRINQPRLDHVCNQNISCTKTKKHPNLNRLPPIEYSELHLELDSNRQPLEYSEWHNEDFNRQLTADYSECHHENVNRKQEYYSEPGLPNSKNRQQYNNTEWYQEDSGRQQFQKHNGKSERSEVESRSSATENKCVRIDNRSYTMEIKPMGSQKYISVQTKESKKSSEKKKSKKHNYENCKVCGIVYTTDQDDKLKSDKHENPKCENSIYENNIKNNTTTEEQKETLRKMFRLKPEDKNVLLVKRKSEELSLLIV